MNTKKLHLLLVALILLSCASCQKAQEPISSVDESSNYPNVNYKDVVLEYITQDGGGAIANLYESSKPDVQLSWVDLHSKKRTISLSYLSSNSKVDKYRIAISLPDSDMITKEIEYSDDKVEVYSNQDLKVLIRPKGD